MTRRSGCHGWIGDGRLPRKGRIDSRASTGELFAHVTQAGAMERLLAMIWSAGGKIVVDKMEVPGVGQLSLFEDPDGRVLGMWKQQQ